METSRNKRGDGTVFQRKKDGLWYLQMSYQTDTGKRKRISKCLGKHPNRTSAVAEARKLKLSSPTKLMQAREKQAAVGHQSVRCDVLLSNYITDLKRRNVASAYVIEKCIEAHIRPFFGSLRVFHLTTSDFDRYRKKRISNDGVKDVTVDHDFTYLRSALMLEHKKKPHTLVPVVPTIPRSGEDNVREGFLEYEGFQQVLEALIPSLKLLFVFGWHLGVRRAALLSLKWPQIQKEAIRFIQKRNGKPMPVYGPIFGEMAKWITLQREVREAEYPECEHVFFWHERDCTLNGTHGGRRMKPGSPIIEFRSSWENGVTKAGFPDLLFHDLRRSAIRNMVENAGLSEKRAMEISGHKTREVFMRYNIVNAADVNESGKRMDAWMKTQTVTSEPEATQAVPDKGPELVPAPFAQPTPQTLATPPRPAVVPTSTEQTGDVLEQLERYVSLFERGMLSEEEFATLKQRLIMPR